MDSRQRIYVTGYPRSGNVWLGRSLADGLGCEYNSADDDPLSDWPGDKTDAPYLVRKGHVLDTPDRAHTVFVYRDPRDVAVSVMYYLGYESLAATIEAMTKSIEKFNVGPYAEFIKAWWANDEHHAAIEVRYEEMQIAPLVTLWRAVRILLGVDWPLNRFRRAVERQAFEAARARYGPTQYHHLRKGIAGDWRNHFAQADGQLMQDHFGELMKQQHYITADDWWTILPQTREHETLP